MQVSKLRREKVSEERDALANVAVDDLVRLALLHKLAWMEGKFEMSAVARYHSRVKPDAPAPLTATSDPYSTMSAKVKISPQMKCFSKSPLGSKTGKCLLYGDGWGK